MADVNANIGVNIDTSNALSQLKALQRQISQFHTSISKSSEAAALAQRDLQRNFINSVNSIGAFSAELRTIKTTAESFTDSLEKNKFSMREYFRFAGGATKTFGKLFKSEFDTINKVSEENVKRLQTQYIKMGRDASGAMRAIAIMPNELDMSNISTQLQISAQRQAIFNQLIKQGSTNLLNFGKNTQWAGRQLMVGFTLPLMALGTTASRTFMDMEAAALKFRKVYGDLFTPTEEREQALSAIQELGESFTKYGIAVSATVSLAADAAAAGFQGIDLQRQVTEATRLQVLGQIDQQKALETTISLQNAFKLSNEDLSDSINFLNAVENQTVVSLDDITTAIPKVAPVIMQLGGNVKDLAFFMTAMKQGGVNASEGANALKSGLAALINPTEKAAAMLANMGINIKKIVEGNQGNLRATVVEFAKALDTLDPLTRARAIEQLFGKFQFARLSTLFENVTAGGTQAARVLDLAGYSAEDLAATAESELGMTAESSMNKFRKAVEDLKLALVPVGQVFLESVTPILEFVGNILDKFNNLSSGMKKAITVITVALGAIAPVALMTFGLLANFMANGIKGLMLLRNGYLRLTGQTQVLGEQTQFLTLEQQNALAVASSLDQSHARLVQTFTAESIAVQKLANSYDKAIASGMRFAQTNPGMMRQPFLPGFADGIISVPGSGSEDKYPAMLAAGEAVIPAKQNKKYAPLIAGIIADNIPGFKLGRKGSAAGTFTTSASTLKEDIGLYKAPSAIKSQTTGMAWATYEAEISAMENSVRQYLEDQGMSAQKIASIMKQLTQKQASHITKQVQQIEVAGEVVDVKLWNADNLIADLGGINNYLNSIHKITQSLKRSDIEEMAQQLNMSIDQFEQELANLSEGIHPTTRSSASVLKAVSERGVDSSDIRLAYQSRAVSAGLGERLSGDFYETARQRAYDPEKDLRSLEQVEQKLIQFRQKIVNAFNISDEIAQIAGMSTQGIQNVWDQLGVEAKARLLELKNDANAFTQALFNEAQEAGIAGFELGDAAIRGIAKGTQSNSNSKRAIQEGRNVDNGFEQGILEGMDDASLAGQKLGDSAIDGISMGTGGGAGGRVAGAAAAGASGAGGTGGVAAPTRNLAKFNSALMGVSFAMTSVSGIASAFGGRFQGLSEAVFKISGLMFGLMSVVQLLTQEMFANVVANRANKVANIMGATSFKTLFANTSGFGSKLLTAGKFLARFAGGIGALVGVVTLSIAAFKWVNKEREKERKAIMGLADASNITAEKLKTLGDFFGIKPVKNPMLQAVPQIRMTAERRGRVDELKASESFKKDFADDIEELRKATAKEAEIVFKSIALSLGGQGFAKEQIKDIIDALREEAGKTDVLIDLKSLDLKTKEGQSGFAKLASDITNQLSVAAKNGYQEVQILKGVVSETGQAYSQWTTELKPTISLQRAANASGQQLFNMMTGLAGGLESGAIGAKEFNQGFTQLESTMKAVEKTNPSAALLMMQSAIKQLNPETQKLFDNLTKTEDIMLMLRAQALGLTAILPGLASAIKAVNAGYTGDATSFVQAQLDLDRYKKMLEAAAKESEEWIKKITGTRTGSGDGEKSAFQKAIEQLTEQRKNLLNASDAYNKLRKNGINTARAFEIASDPILAAAIATTKVGSKKWKELLALIKDVNKELSLSELKNFFETRDAEVKFQQNFAKIIPLLKGLGLEAEDIQDILSNPIIAKEFIKDLKDGQLNALELKNYIDQIPELKKIKILLENPQDQFKEAFDSAMEYFNIQSDLAEAEYKPKIVNAEKEVESAQKTVDDINSEIDSIQKTIDKAQRVIVEKFDRPIDDIQEEISDLQRNIEKNIDRPIEELNRQIEKLQRNIEEQFDRPIAALQEESSDLANDLTLIDKSAEAINKKYDAQAKALEQVSEINQEILNQQKNQLDIADALTQGDISSAARAIQESRAQAASAASQRTTGLIDAARQEEISKLRSASGMTREQIEQRQFQIGQEIFSLEEKRDLVQAKILAKQDQIYIIEQNRIPILDQIRIKEDEIYDLTEDREKAVLAIRLDEDKIYNIQVKRLEPAQAELEKKQAALKAVQDELKGRQDAIELEKQKWIAADLALKAAQIESGKYEGILASIQAKTKAALDNINGLDKTVTTTHIINTVYQSTGNSPGTSIYGSFKAKMYGGKIKKMASGGIVPGRGMIDKVPTLLTPGEFVINKAATKSFGPLLGAINESKYPSSIARKLESSLIPQNIVTQSFQQPIYSISKPTAFSMPVQTNMNSVSDNSNTVYNYSVGINVGGTNASADTIARAVLDEIKYIDLQRIRGQRA